MMQAALTIRPILIDRIIWKLKDILPVCARSPREVNLIQRKSFANSLLTASKSKWFNKDTTLEHFFIGTLSNLLQYFVLFKSYDLTDITGKLWTVYEDAKELSEENYNLWNSIDIDSYSTLFWCFQLLYENNFKIFNGARFSKIGQIQNWKKNQPYYSSTF